MENSSHAILMVAGIAIAMAIVGALLFAFHTYSNFKKEQQEFEAFVKEIEQKKKEFDIKKEEIMKTNIQHIKLFMLLKELHIQID